MDRVGVRLAVVLWLSTMLAAPALGPASASSADGCPKFKPAEPDSPASQTAEALDAEVHVLGPDATEDSPLVVPYAHGPAFWELGHRIQEDEVFFNVLVPDPQASKGLHVRIDFAYGHINEADLFLYDERGERVASSASFGLGGPISDPGNGGVGYDYIPGSKVSACDGFTIESRALWGPGGDATLSVWLGPRGRDIPNEDGQEGAL